MCIRSRSPTDIAKADAIQLRSVSPASSIDRKQDGPRDAATNGTDGNDGSEEAEKEIRIQRMMLKNEVIS